MKILKYGLLKIKKYLLFIACPQIKDKKEKRKIFILNLILIGLIQFLVILILIYFIKIIVFPFSCGIIFWKNFIYLFLSLSYLAFLFYLSKKIKTKTPPFLLIVFFFFLILKMTMLWGTDFPLTIIFLIIIILLSGVLISATFSFLAAAVSSLMFFVLCNLEFRKIINPDLSWKTENIVFKNLIIFILLLLIFAFLAWFFNKEIESGLEKCSQLEKDLKTEKNLLEIKIKQTKEEIKESQKREIEHLAQLAEFGRLSGGFFHELANPLTTINLSMEEVNRACQQDSFWNKFSFNIEKSVLAAKKMGKFLSSIRKQIAKKDEKTNFSLNNEIEEVIEILEPKAKKNSVSLIFKSNKNIFIFNSQIKFHQLVANLISNAIDSYTKKCTNSYKTIFISLQENKKEIILSVKDNGCGLSNEIKEKIFSPFFTTKCPCNNSGLGLFLARSITKRDFKGKIKIKSKKNKGSKFTVIIPKIKSSKS